MKVMGYVFRLLGGSQASAKTRGYTQQRYTGPERPDGNVHIDYIPDKEKKSSGKFKGGEYVDYEEVE